MAQTVTPQCNEGYSGNQQQSDNNSTFVVVDQQPHQRESFPYKLHPKWILGFSIAKCIIGTSLFITGIMNVLRVKYDIKVGAPILCGVISIACGIIGFTLNYYKNKCLIGVFFALSATTLILDVAMLPFYSVVLHYFVDYYHYYICYTIRTIDTVRLGTGISSFLIALIVLELACSIGSVVLSCRAYSKYCSTCDTSDCCTYLGCCECDCLPLNISQSTQPAATTYFGHQNMQMSSFQPPPYQLNQQRAQSNPCSDIVSVNVSIPSYVFGTAKGTQLSAINATLQPDTSTNQQAPPSEHDRGAAQMQGTTSIPVRSNQPNSVLIT